MPEAPSFILAIYQNTGNAVLFCIVQRIFCSARSPIVHCDHQIGMAHHPLVPGLVRGVGKVGQIVLTKSAQVSTC